MHVQLQRSVEWADVFSVRFPIQPDDVQQLRAGLLQLPDVSACVHRPTGLQQPRNQRERVDAELPVHVSQFVERDVVWHLPRAVQRDAGLRNVRCCVLGLLCLPELLPDVYDGGQLLEPRRFCHRQRRRWVQLHVPEPVEWSDVQRVRCELLDGTGLRGVCAWLHRLPAVPSCVHCVAGLQQPCIEREWARGELRLQLFQRMVRSYVCKLPTLCRRQQELCRVQARV